MELIAIAQIPRGNGRKQHVNDRSHGTGRRHPFKPQSLLRKYPTLGCQRSALAGYCGSFHAALAARVTGWSDFPSLVERTNMRSGSRPLRSSIVVSAVCLTALWTPTHVSAQTNIRERLAAAVETVEGACAADCKVTRGEGRLL